MSETCYVFPEDAEILKKLAEEAVSVVHLGHVASDDVLKDVYFIVKNNRVAHLVEIRKICVVVESKQS